MEIARLGRVRGLKGELFASGEQSPEWYAALPTVRVRLANGEWYAAPAPAGAGETPPPVAAELKIALARDYSGSLALRFEGIDSATVAQALVNGKVLLERRLRPPAPAGEYWLSDLIGCVLEDTVSGHELGTVTGWQGFTPGKITIEAAPSGPAVEPVLVPFVKSIFRDVDVAGRRIRIDPPAGLFTLNLSGEGEPGAPGAE